MRRTPMQFTFRVPPVLREALDREAAQARRTVSDVIRLALEDRFLASPTATRTEQE